MIGGKPAERLFNDPKLGAANKRCRFWESGQSDQAGGGEFRGSRGSRVGRAAGDAGATEQPSRCAAALRERRRGPVLCVRRGWLVEAAGRSPRAAGAARGERIDAGFCLPPRCAALAMRRNLASAAPRRGRRQPIGRASRARRLPWSGRSRRRQRRCSLVSMHVNTTPPTILAVRRRLPWSGTLSGRKMIIGVRTLRATPRVRAHLLASSRVRAHLLASCATSATGRRRRPP